VILIIVYRKLFEFLNFSYLLFLFSSRYLYYLSKYCSFSCKFHNNGGILGSIWSRWKKPDSEMMKKCKEMGKEIGEKIEKSFND